MKYFIDQEFHEYKKTVKVLGLPVAGVWTIELISIGIVSEDDRTYYAICNEFDIKEAWNKYQWKDTGKLDLSGISLSKEKEYWLRDNVLRSIWKELRDRYLKDTQDKWDGHIHTRTVAEVFSLGSLNMLIGFYGKSKKEIASDIISFTRPYEGKYFTRETLEELSELHNFKSDYKPLHFVVHTPQPEFYGYYADYDWVIFCWIFGKMIDLPNGFPMYCRDLKQMLDDKAILLVVPGKATPKSKTSFYYPETMDDALKIIKGNEAYPKQNNEHHALADAKWNKALYNFLQTK